MALVRERAGSNINTAVLRDMVYEGGYQQKEAFEKLFSGNPLFDKRDDCLLSRPDYVKKSIHRSMETYKILKANKEQLAAHSPLHGKGGFYVGGANTPSGLTDHFALFVNTILYQGTPAQQREWLMKSINLQMIGTYAQTELGHGSNVRGLETTATYDSATDEFIINSPTVSAAKWWPGALGLLCTHAATYARLLIDGKDLGFHAFMVQIRDEKHHPIAGVQVGDIGPKMGYNAYDSGYLLLKNVRVPRFNMFARFQQVAKGGAYTKAAPALQKIAYLTMLKTRVFIAAMSGGGLGRTLTIALRYNAKRLQGFKNSKKGGEENVILDYQIQQERLFGGLSTAFTMHFAGRRLEKILTTFEAVLKKSKDGKGDFSQLPVLHAAACGMKAFCTQMGTDYMEEARKCCGGHGYTLSSGIGGFNLTYLPAVTYEGDYTPMALQTARFLVFSMAQLQKGKELPELAAYLGQDESDLPATVDDFLNVDKVLGVLQNAARSAATQAAMDLYADVTENKMNKDDAWIASHAILMRAANYWTCELLMREFRDTIAEMKDATIAAAMSRLCVHFGLLRIHEIKVAHHKLSPEAVANLEKAKLKLLAAIRPDCINLVEGFGQSDHQLASTIGSYDNEDMYERMVAHARRNPLNTPEFQSAFHSEVLSSFLNREVLKAKM
jgi:acyl-CoA oxidase